MFSNDILYNMYCNKHMLCLGDCPETLYCIVRPYTKGRLDRYRIGIPRELSEIRTQSWLSEGSFNLRSMSPQGTHLLIARRRNSITSVLVTIS